MNDLINMVGYNWTAAFVAFARGTPLDDIAFTMAIPISSLRNKARIDGWSRLAKENAPFVACIPTSAEKAEERLAKIEANRAKNLEIIQKLQADLVDIVGRLLDGSLMITKTTSVGLPIQVPPSIKDRKDLADYAKTVAEASYRALGDTPPAPQSEGTGAGAPVVNVILPVQVATPRASRSEVVGSHVPDAPELIWKECKKDAGHPDGLA